MHAVFGLYIDYNNFPLAKNDNIIFPCEEKF